MIDACKKIVFSISPNPSVNFLRYKAYHLERDVYRIASIIFNIETASRMGHIIENVSIPISQETYDIWDVPYIEAILSDLLRAVVLTDIKIKLVRKNLNKGKRNVRKEFDRAESICLFSGGVDSTTGLIKSLEYYRGDTHAVFVCHGDQGKVGRVINKVSSLINAYRPFNLHVVHGPKMHSEGYSQLRGFFYVIAAAIYANLCQSNNIIVAECGPTMYQTRYSPFDSITMTTHPLIMSKTNALCKLFFHKDFRIVLPFENLTKAELVSLNPLPNLFPFTHSCIGTRWIDSGVKGKKANDGTCFGCVTRSLSLLTAGIKDTSYENNPLIDSSAYQDHLINLLAFSTDLLLSYDDMDDFTKEIIMDYDKFDLFHRFALDNIAAIHLLCNSDRPINEKIRVFYDDVLKLITIKELDQRIKDVRGQNYVPDFNKIVT